MNKRVLLRALILAIMAGKLHGANLVLRHTTDQPVIHEHKTATEPDALLLIPPDFYSLPQGNIPQFFARALCGATFSGEAGVQWRLDYPGQKPVESKKELVQVACSEGLHARIDLSSVMPKSLTWHSLGGGAITIWLWKPEADGQELAYLAVGMNYEAKEVEPIEGPAGRDGKDGQSIVGPAGPAGRDGKNGLNGKPGRDGKDCDCKECKRNKGD